MEYVSETFCLQRSVVSVMRTWWYARSHSTDFTLHWTCAVWSSQISCWFPNRPQCHECIWGFPFLALMSWRRYHGGQRPSSDDSLHSPTAIPPSALDKSSIIKRYHRQRTTRWGVTARLPTMVTLHDSWFVECRWWNDGWTVKTVVTWRSSASIIPAPGPFPDLC